MSGKEDQPKKLAKDHLTEDVILQLYAFTHRKMRKLKGAKNFSYLTPKELAHEAITKTLAGDRPWNSNKCPELFAHLAGCARSIFYNHHQSKETRSFETNDNMDCFYEKNEGSLSDSMLAHRSNSSTSFSPEDIQEAISDLESLMDYLVENRDDLIELAEAMLVNEISKPQELATHLGINVAKVNAKKLALKRIVLKMQEGDK